MNSNQDYIFISKGFIFLPNVPLGTNQSYLLFPFLEVEISELKNIKEAVEGFNLDSDARFDYKFDGGPNTFSFTIFIK